VADELVANDEPIVAQEREGAEGSTADEPGVVEENALSRPSLDISAQLRADLEQQFQRVRSRLETEDAFSELLGEEYLSYGLLLKKAGRLDEAREMIVDAMHIAKINNGIYSVEQLPTLYALFDVDLLKGELERFEDTLKRIVWLEQQVDTEPDAGTFARLVEAGNYFLDEFLYRPIASEQSVVYLDKADKYLSGAVRLFGRRPMTELLMPYGELALVHFHKNSVALQSTSLSQPIQERSRPNPIYRGSSQAGRGRPPGLSGSNLDTLVNSPRRSLSRGEYFLRLFG